MEAYVENPVQSPSEPEKRRQIVTAARRLFAQKRYDDVTVPEIVKAAGVAQGTFYRYFESKALLVDAITSDLQRDLTAAIQQIVEQDDPVTELLELLIRTVLNTFSTYRDVLPFLRTDGLLFGDSKEADRQREPFLETIAQLIRRDQARGGLPNTLNAALTARLMDSLIGRVVRDCLLKSDEAFTEAYIAETVSFLTRALGAKRTGKNGQARRTPDR